MLLVKRWNISFIILGLFILIEENLQAQKTDSAFIKSIDSSKIILINGNGQNSNGSFSDEYYQTAGQILDKPFRVRVVFSNNTPVKGCPVYFSTISIPAKSKDTKLLDEVILTNQEGFAETFAVLGSAEGSYKFAARIKNTGDENDIIYFGAYARNESWVFYLTSGLIGGLGLFLFGLGMMSDGLKKTTGSKMRSLLGKITNNRFIAVAAGTFITMIIQSSSATTVMLVSFVQAQLMTFAQSLGVILGADIGTTITAQLIAFKLTDYALIVIGFGFAMIFFLKSKKLKNIGESIFGFGTLFFGMWIMSNAMEPLRTYEPFLNIVLELENPLLGILVGTAFTALIQSSGAFTGIIIVLGSQGLITLEAAIPLLFGANIGTSVTAALASINTCREAKRVALAHTLFKIIGVLIFVWWIPSFANFVRWLSPAGTEGLTGTGHLAEVVPRQIANAHTIFNVGLTLIMLPFTNQAAKLIYKLLPDKAEPEKESKFHAKFLENSLISTPTLALSLAKAETLRMANKVQQNVENIIQAFFKNDEKLLDHIRECETEVNFLNVQINKYLTKISQQSLAEERIDEIYQIMYSVTELEQIGDIVAKGLIPLAEKKMMLNFNFSKEGEEEIRDYHLRTIKQISRSIEVFKDLNLKEAKRMEKKYKKYRLMEMDLRKTHFNRLRSDIPETIATSEIHLELIELLKRISSHATNIARSLLELKSDKEADVMLKAEPANIKKNEIKEEDVCDEIDDEDSRV
jgi:phosphate:Na+ symporter